MSSPLPEPRVIRLRSLAGEEYAWMPAEARFPARRVTFEYHPTPAAVALFGNAKMLPPADFIRTVPVTDGAGKGGYCDPDRYPYQVQLLGLMRHPAWQTFVLAAGNQAGKSTMGEFYAADSACNNPRDIGIFYPAAKPVQRKFRDSLAPIFKSRGFRHLCTGLEDDLNSNSIKLSLMTITAGNTASLLDMSSFSFAVVMIEEADKIVEEVTKVEASVKWLLKGRTQDHGRDGKTIWISTLTVDNAPCAKELAAVEVRFDFLPCCPFCGQEHQLDDKNLDYYIDSKMFGFAKKVQGARYVCPRCKVKWTEEDRRQALISGKIRAREQGWQDKVERHEPYLHDPRPLQQYLDEQWPASCGISIPALALPAVSMQSIAEVVEQAKTDMAAAQYLANHVRAETFRLSSVRRTAEQVLRRTWGKPNPQPRRVVPRAEEISYILAGVDVQHKSVYYTVVAFGWQYTRNGDYCRPTTWIVDAGQIDTVDHSGNHLPVDPALRQVESMTFLDEDGSAVRANGSLYAVDGVIADMRGRNSPDGGDRMLELKMWAAQTAGSTRRNLNWGERYDFKGKLYEVSYTPDPLRPGGMLPFLRSDRNRLEQWVESGLMALPDDHGALLLNADFTIEQAEHLCAAEVNQKTGRWQAVPGRQHDYRDCVRYAALLWHYLLDISINIFGPESVRPPWMR